MASKYNLKESDIKKAIKDYLTLTGWFHFHNMAGLASFPGIPDRTAIKNGVTLWIECKSPTGSQTSVQKEFERNIKEQKEHYVLARSVQDVNDYICKHFWETGIEF